MGTDYKLVYEREWKDYEGRDILPEEAVLLELFRDFWHSAHMLDLGVGAGRTTSFFSPKVASYIGIDSVPKMVEVCRQAFPDNDKRQSLLGDASNLSRFKDATFDFVLFSYNGIDHLDYEGRIRALKEIRRVLKPSGLFFFSSHAFSVLPFHATGIPHLGLNPVRWRAKWKEARWEKQFFTKVNAIATEPSAQSRGWAILPDKIHGGEMELFYIRPNAQVAQLEQVGFSLDRLLNTGGNTVTNLDKPGGGWWFSYLCRPKKEARRN